MYSCTMLVPDPEKLQRGKAAARHALGVRTANDRARTHAFCPQMQHNRATTLRFIARLPQESYEPYEYPWSSHDCPPAVLAIALQLFKHIWRQPCVWTQDKRASIVRIPYV